MPDVSEGEHLAKAARALRHYGESFLRKKLSESPRLNFALEEKGEDYEVWDFLMRSTDYSELPCENYKVVVCYGSDYVKDAKKIYEDAKATRHAYSFAVYDKESFAATILGNRPREDTEDVLYLGDTFA